MPDYENAKKWYDFLTRLGNWIPWVILVMIVFIIFKYPTQLQLLVAGIQRLFGSISVMASKKSIENEIDARVIKASKDMCKEIEEVIPYSIKINWVKESSKEAFFDDNRVIVCMDHNRTKNQNVVYAINDYVEHGLMPALNKHIDSDVIKSSKLVLTKKLLSISYKKGLTYFLNEIFLVATEKDGNIKEIVEELIRLDESGMFVQILLREYIDKGKKYALGVVHSDFKKETKDLVYYLFNIANREPGEINQLDFIGKYFKVGIILVADSTVYNMHGEKAYTRRFIEKLKLGIENIYLCSRKGQKVDIALKVRDEIKKEFSDIESPKVFYYNGRYKDYKEYKGVCIAYNNISDSIIAKYT